MNRDIATMDVSELKTYPGIYHSPQTPGWVSWASIVQLDSGDVVVGLNEVTGSRNPRGPVPLPEVMRAFGDPHYNMEGLTKTFRIIRAGDARSLFARWEPLYIELQDGPWPPAHFLLVQTSRGALLRQTQGRRIFQEVSCGAVSRSEDKGRTWGPYAPVCPSDAWRFLAISRAIELRDGRLLMSAYGAGQDEPSEHTSVYLLTSSDDGKTWSEPACVLECDGAAVGNESAIMELPDGDILMMARVHDLHGAGLNRRQLRLKRQGATWTPGPTQELDIPHGGHPEFLMTREGVLLYVSTQGFWGSVDEGEEWTRIRTLPGSSYYPHAVQLDDGRVLVVGHNGGDHGYPPTEDMMIWKVCFRIDRVFA